MLLKRLAEVSDPRDPRRAPRTRPVILGGSCRGYAAPAEAVSTPDVFAADKPPGSRAPGWARRHRPLYREWRAGVFVARLAVAVAGVIMLPLPGPAG